MSSESKNEESFKVSCELQLRFRKVDAEELRVFKEFGLRPSPYTSLRMGIETELNRLSLQGENRILLEKAFQLLLNIDQRLERMEEFIQNQNGKEPMIRERHEWFHADLNASGLAFIPMKDSKLSSGDTLMLDMIFPSFPEQRIVCSGQVMSAAGKNNAVQVNFVDIHQDDREFLHRFVMEREREILRARKENKS